MTRKWTHIRRDIEVVITRRSWKPFVRKGAWVRIPPSPLLLPGVISTPCNFFLANAAGRIKELIQYYVLDQPGEVPKRLKGLPWKGSRSLIAARGFKSLLLRYTVSWFILCCAPQVRWWHWRVLIFERKSFLQRRLEDESLQKIKKLKKVLTTSRKRANIYIVVAQDKRTTDKRERLREAW